MAQRSFEDIECTVDENFYGFAWYFRAPSYSQRSLMEHVVHAYRCVVHESGIADVSFDHTNPRLLDCQADIVPASSDKVVDNPNFCRPCRNKLIDDSTAHETGSASHQATCTLKPFHIPLQPRTLRTLCDLS